MVPRTALLERLLATPTRLICVAAPSGYGKTTLLAQWAERRAGRVAWVSLDRRDNDPVVLLRHLATALDWVQPIGPAAFRTLASPGAAVPASLIPRFVAGLSSMTWPVAVVLDNLELLVNQACVDALIEVALRLPPGRWRWPPGPGRRCRPRCHGRWTSCWKWAPTTWPWTRERSGRCWSAPGSGCVMPRSPGCSSEPRGGRSGCTWPPWRWPARARTSAPARRVRATVRRPPASRRRGC